jgi:hypothetical protein
MRSYYLRSLTLLEKLNKKYPQHSICKHLSLAFMDYKDLWDVSDKVFFTALEEYLIELESDVKHNDDEIEKIINDGMHLNSILEEDNEFDD